MSSGAREPAADAADPTQVAGDAARGGAEFDAFMSYSHAADGRLGPALQAGLHRFARPWHRLRALRIFRDDASLSANPSLWSAITAALDRSRWFILLASPEAAASKWVDREVAYWRSGKSSDRILIVLTAGEIEWDGSTGDFDWSRTTALPRSLGGAFASEPRFVDLHWARSADDVSLANARFRDAVGDVAAPLHGRPKDELLGEDVRQHRRTQRITRAVGAALAVLAATATAAAVLAVDQRQQARAQRDRAEAQARLALSRQLAAEAIGAPDDQLDLGLLLAAESYAVERTPQGEAALAQTLLRSPHAATYLPGTRSATAVAFSPDGRTLAVGTERGMISLWHAGSLRPAGVLQRRAGGRVTSLAFSGDGHRVAGGCDDGSVLVSDSANGRKLLAGHLRGRVTGVALDATGARFAVAREDGPVGVWRTDDGRFVQNLRDAPPDPSSLAFDGGGLIAGDGQGYVTRWSLPGGRPSSSSVALGFPLASAFSANLRLFAGITEGNGTPYVVDVRTNRTLRTANLPGPPLLADELGFDTSGRILASTGQGHVVLCDVPTYSMRAEPLAGRPWPRRRSGRRSSDRRCGRRARRRCLEP